MNNNEQACLICQEIFIKGYGEDFAFDKKQIKQNLLCNYNMLLGDNIFS